MNKSPILQKPATSIAEMIVQAYKDSRGVFTNKVNAEDLVPSTTPKNKSQFLFWVIQMDYSTKSSVLYKHANNLWSRIPEWVTTDYILSLSKKDLTSMIREELHPRYPNEIFLRFRTNAKKLKDKYSSQSMNIIDASNSASELLQKIRSFRGFGPKLGNFLTRTYLDMFNLEYEDIDCIMPPVDIHDVRLTYEWGLVASMEMTTTNINRVKKIWSQACLEANLSWIQFDKALWLIGSEGQQTNKPLEDFRKNLGLSSSTD
jgi:endonuclease III